ncbi:MAG: DinB family protein [Tepidiformaceae bacterium]
MTDFQDLFEYNSWANSLVLAGVDELSDEELTAPMDELGGSVIELLGHTAQVEAAFLGLMTGATDRPSRETEYPRIRERLVANSAGYLAAMPQLSERLSERFLVPWFKREFTIEQSLLQVATHSVQHRAGICAGIARAGREAPGLDYIMWLNSNR